jgi:hypothetical protein
MNEDEIIDRVVAIIEESAGGWYLAPQDFKDTVKKIRDEFIILAITGGEFKDESPQAKIRNSLGTMWTLVDYHLMDQDNPLMLSRLVNGANDARPRIKALLKETER